MVPDQNTHNDVPWCASLSFVSEKWKSLTSESFSLIIYSIISSSVSGNFSSVNARSPVSDKVGDIQSLVYLK